MVEVHMPPFFGPDSEWSLRNRLIVTYVFIGVVPLLLIFAMVASGLYLVMGQMATHLVSSEVRSRQNLVFDIVLSSDHPLVPGNVSPRLDFRAAIGTVFLPVPGIYSYRSASTGFRRAAFTAGQNPDSKPITDRMAKEIRKEWAFTNR